MNANEENKRPEEIERDLEQTRAEVSSTLDAIQEKLTPGQLMDQAIDYWRRSAPADFGSNLSRSVRDNPLPVALVGIGLGWLMVSSRKQEPRYGAYRDDYPYDDDYRSDYATTTHGYGSLDSPRYDESDESMLERVKTGASETAGQLRSSAAETADEIRDKASELTARAGHAVDSMRGKASEYGGRMRRGGEGLRGRLSESASSARARVGDLRERSRDGYYRARGSIAQTIEEQPLVLGAVGVAIGAALGASLPATRREDELLGEQRDQLLERTRETAREYVEPMRESVERAAQHVQEEVQQQTAGMSQGQQTGSEFGGTQSASGEVDSDRPGSGF